jgi:hypothetical protein
MTAISIVDYIYDLKQAGFTDRQSEVQARKLEQVITGVQQELRQNIKQEIKQELQGEGLATKMDVLAVKSDVLAVKTDIELLKKDFDLEIEKVRYDALKFTVWAGVAVVVTLVTTLGGMLAKGFHWF